jgi:hypothetical protein
VLSHVFCPSLLRVKYWAGECVGELTELIQTFRIIAVSLFAFTHNIRKKPTNYFGLEEKLSKKRQLFKQMLLVKQKNYELEKNSTKIANSRKK